VSAGRNDIGVYVGDTTERSIVDELELLDRRVAA
jgi:hypothetical protein